MNFVSNKIKNQLKSEDGLIALDFLFGFLLSFAFLMVFFALAYSLTMVEIVQYIAFASSRSYMSADADQATQAKNAQAKATSLITNSNKFANYLNKDWFALGTGGNGTVKVLADDASGEFFIGVEIPLTIKVLDFRIPFFGRTKATNAGEGFSTVVGSYLIREPTESECLNFNSNRAALIQQRGTEGTYPDFSGSYVRISDNGC